MTGGTLHPRGLGHDSITVRIGLATPRDLDDEVVEWLRRAHRENC